MFIFLNSSTPVLQVQTSNKDSHSVATSQPAESLQSNTESLNDNSRLDSTRKPNSSKSSEHDSHSDHDTSQQSLNKDVLSDHDIPSDYSRFYQSEQNADGLSRELADQATSRPYNFSEDSPSTQEVGFINTIDSGACQIDDVSSNDSNLTQHSFVIIEGTYKHI